MNSNNTSSDTIKLVEVGPRDGLQNESQVLSVDQRVAWIQQLSACGLTHIEVGSFVSAKRLPQVANTDAVLQKLSVNSGKKYSVLVPNWQGFEAAVAAGATEIAVFTAASETFTQKNINCGIDTSLERYAAIAAAATAVKIPVRAYISCAIACPYEGAIKPSRVAAIATKLLAMGCYEISLGDTIGVGTPKQSLALLQTLSHVAPISQLAVHFHDTYGQAIANIYASLDFGIRTIDAAAGGLGGCPYANGASGNVATEDVIYLCEGLGLHTGVDLNKLVTAANAIQQHFSRPLSSKVGRALLKMHQQNPMKD